MVRIFEKPLKELAKIQNKYPLLVILTVLTVSLFLGYYALRIETDSNFNVMFREDSESIMLEKLVNTEFGGSDTLFILAKIDADVNDKTRVQDIRHPDVIKGMNHHADNGRDRQFPKEFADFFVGEHVASCFHFHVSSIS